MSPLLPVVHIPSAPKPSSILALGSGLFGAIEIGGQNEAQAAGLLAAALEQGITHFDTAAGYGHGQAERWIGRFAHNQRERLFLASKSTIDQGTAQEALAAVEASLARLDSEYIDLYYIHWPKPGLDMRPFMEGLQQARAQGKIHAVGVSNFNAEQMAHVAQAGQIDALQIPYNPLWRHAERETLPYCRENGIAVLTYGSLAMGILSGRFGREPQLKAGEYKDWVIHFQPELWPHVYEAVEQMKALAAQIDRPLPQLVLRWIVRQPGITACLIGASTPTQIAQNVAAFQGEIDEAIFDRFTALSDAVMRYIPERDSIYK